MHIRCEQFYGEQRSISENHRKPIGNHKSCLLPPFKKMTLRLHIGQTFLSLTEFIEILATLVSPNKFIIKIYLTIYLMLYREILMVSYHQIYLMLLIMHYKY
jgi:hypothetical protein